MRIPLLVMASFVVIGFVALHGAYDRLPGDGRLSALKSNRNLGNGETLFHIGGCVSCHTSSEQDEPPRLRGGAPIKTAFGAFYPPYISPNRDDGIGAWAEVEFIRAMCSILQDTPPPTRTSLNAVIISSRGPAIARNVILHATRLVQSSTIYDYLVAPIPREKAGFLT